MQLEQLLQVSSGDIERDSMTSEVGLVHQNVSLRSKLEDEHNTYKRKIQAYQDGQQRQALLIQKLQSKVNASMILPT